MIHTQFLLIVLLCVSLLRPLFLNWRVFVSVFVVRALCASCCVVFVGWFVCLCVRLLAFCWLLRFFALFLVLFCLCWLFCDSPACCLAPFGFPKAVRVRSTCLTTVSLGAGPRPEPQASYA